MSSRLARSCPLFFASIGILYLVFRRSIPKSYRPEDLPTPQSAIANVSMFRISWVLLVLLMIGYIATELWHIPVSFVAIAIAILFLVAGARTKVTHPFQVVKEAPWAIVFFSIGMYVVVYGLRNAGLTDWLGLLLKHSMAAGLFSTTLFTGFVAAILSSVMNNLPSVMIGALAIHATHASGIIQHAMVYANVIGCDLGPKITPIGSLATLLWLHVLGKKGIQIRWGYYFKVGIITTIPVLFVTLTGLLLWIQLIGQ